MRRYSPMELVGRFEGRWDTQGGSRRRVERPLLVAAKRRNDEAPTLFEGRLSG